MAGANSEAHNFNSLVGVNRDIKENSKRFWSDIKSKRQEPTGVSPPFK
jgi:hypothetical protein